MGRINKKIIEFNISVDYILLVALGHSLDHLIKYFADLGLVQPFIQLCHNFT